MKVIIIAIINALFLMHFILDFNITAVMSRQKLQHAGREYCDAVSYNNYTAMYLCSGGKAR